jgi:hypothetical protein
MRRRQESGLINDSISMKNAPLIAWICSDPSIKQLIEGLSL